MFVWSFILWSMVILILVLMSLAGICMAGGADLGSCAGCDLTGMSCFGFDNAAPEGLDVGTFYWGGAVPYHSFWGFSGYPHNTSASCEGNCCRWFAMPFAAVLYMMPVPPENVWGGVIGWFMGTHDHISEQRRYQGNNRMVEFLAMRWRRPTDLHRNEEWREQVATFLGETQSTSAAAGEQSEHIAEAHEGRFRIGGFHVINTNRSFSQELDRCFATSFEDYQKNQCWICLGSEAEEWDLWLSCRHMFCCGCSTTMMKRGMPCPLCRISSSTVLRGLKKGDTSLEEMPLLSSP
mmetsp:Transcript_18088/g.48601  ORF Transcript_18088/g.48601 Transcript_18088/m.48601 type:complete len:293 (-) Transcript_18088:109-987(-)